MRLFGSSRRVFLIGPLAIKFPSWADTRSFLKGLLHNYTEGQRWRQWKDYRMAPVYWTAPLGFMLIMRRVAIPLFDSDGWDRRTEELEELFNDVWFAQDIKPDNFGYLPDGNLVCIDYGG